MDPNIAALALITDLYSQVRGLMEENAKLRAENNQLNEAMIDNLSDTLGSKTK